MSEGKSAATPPERPPCDYTGAAALSSDQLCRCGTCQLYAKLLFNWLGSVAAPKAQPDVQEELLSALRAIRTCLKADCGEVGQYFDARKWLRDHNRYEENLQCLAVPLEVAEYAIRLGEACAPKAGEPPQAEVPREFPAQRLIRSAEIDGEMEQLSNSDLSEKLLSLWAHTDILSAESSVLSEAVDRLRGAGSPPQELSEVAAEQKRWQDGIYERLKKAVGPKNDFLIDGGGCDSGDPLDFTLTEIGQALAYWQDRALSEEDARLCGAGETPAERPKPEKKAICQCGHKARSHGPNWNGESPEKEATGFPVCHYPGCKCMDYCAPLPPGAGSTKHPDKESQ